MATMRPQRSKNLLCSLIMSCVSSVGGAEGTSGRRRRREGKKRGNRQEKTQKEKGRRFGVFRAHHEELVVAPPLGAHPEVLIHAEPRNEL